MRLIKAFLALMFVALGVIFSALNRDPVRIDLGFATLDTHLGAGLLFALLAGALLAGVVLLASVVWPLRQRLRKIAGTTEPAVAPERHD